MFDKVLDDLKDCERDLQEIVDDKETEEWVSLMLRSVIYTIQKTQKNIREITDDCVRNDDDDAFIIY
jgi:3-phenylpropionate/cinnamic acid dioxygenase small subunit